MTPPACPTTCWWSPAAVASDRISTEGLLGDAWQRSIFDFYTLDGAVKLRDAFAQFRGGRVVINLVELPIKCPVAPLEFAFLADEFFEKQGIRGDVELTYVTPLDGAFTKPIASARLDHLLAEKKVKVVTEFSTGSVTDHDLVSYDERRVPFDLLVTIPTHSGANFVERSGLGNELAFIPTDHHSLAAKGLDNVFVVGDATDVPASKAGSVAHFEAETLIENLERAATGREPSPPSTATPTASSKPAAARRCSSTSTTTSSRSRKVPAPGRWPLQSAH